MCSLSGHGIQSDILFRVCNKSVMSGAGSHCAVVKYGVECNIKGVSLALV